MRIIVCGGRHYADRRIVESALTVEVESKGWADETIVIVHGDATGADRLAADVASNFGWECEAHPARWDLHGKAAGPIRNEEIAQAGGDLCIAFPGGRGTADMVRRAENHNIPVRVIDG